MIYKPISYILAWYEVIPEEVMVNIVGGEAQFHADPTLRENAAMSKLELVTYGLCVLKNGEAAAAGGFARGVHPLVR